VSSQWQRPRVEGAASWMTRSRGSIWSKRKSGEWSERDMLVLERSLDPLATAHEQASEQVRHVPNADVHVWGTQRGTVR
jgi:hypothetical protein